MTMTSNCGCGSMSNSCDSSIAELPRYYPRQLITPDDLTLEQNYFRDRLRRHNRLMHGWGVVCGALVCPVPSPAGSDPSVQFVAWQVQVQTGYILGPYGDEIILDCSRTVDLRSGGVSGVTGDSCVEPVDPWCSQVFTPPATSTLYIAVKYKQCMTRPVRVQPVGCGCSDTSCEYSRWHDGYEIGVLTQCPPCTDSSGKGLQRFELLAEGDVPACPDCSCGPWVGLASVTVNPDGSIKQIDNCSCRRLVVAFNQFSWQCTGSSPSVAGFFPTSINADGTDQQVVVTGANLRCGVSATFGPNTTTKQVLLKDSETLQATVNVVSGATSDPKQNLVTVTNMDGTSGVSTSPIVFPSTAATLGPPLKTGNVISPTKTANAKKPVKTHVDS
jgi:hypothetical protein